MGAASVPVDGLRSPGAAASAFDRLFGEGSVARRFPGLSGRALQKNMLEAIQISDMSTPFFKDANGTMQRNMARHPENMRAPGSVKNKYKQIIKSSGIVDGARGQAWAQAPAPFPDQA